MKIWKRMIPLALALLLLAGCAENVEIPENGEVPQVDESVFLDQVTLEEVDLTDEMVALSSSPAALPIVLKPVASGAQVKKNTRVTVDYSNAKDGYVMVNFTDTTSTRLKVKVIGPSSTEYVYNLTAKEWTTFPLSDGNGSYTVKVYEQNTKNTKYAVVLTASFSVTLTDEFAPFLRPNQYVNYENAENTVAMGQELAGEIKDPLKKVEAIYDYVVKNFTYDKERAATVQSGYLPNLDSVLKEKKGICFDYAALMTAMLRSQGVPCKLVTGDAGGAFHAWVSVWTEETGWVEGVIYFDGSTWQRMDPTFASSGNSSEKIMQYIGDGKNYSSKNFY